MTARMSLVQGIQEPPQFYRRRNRNQRRQHRLLNYATGQFSCKVLASADHQPRCVPSAFSATLMEPTYPAMAGSVSSPARPGSTLGRQGEPIPLCPANVSNACFPSSDGMSTAQGIRADPFSESPTIQPLGDSKAVVRVLFPLLGDLITRSLPGAGSGFPGVYGAA